MGSRRRAELARLEIEETFWHVQMHKRMKIKENPDLLQGRKAQGAAEILMRKDYEGEAQRRKERGVAEEI